MSKTKTRTLAGAGVCAIALAIAAVATSVFRTDDSRIRPALEVALPPKLFPDYSGIRIPYNIAPLNFVIDEPGARYQIRIASGSREIVVSSRGPGISIPADEWRTMLFENRGKELRIDVFVDTEGLGWKKFATVRNEVSGDPIDRYLVYRELLPQFYLKMGMIMKQRCLEDFDETDIIDNRQFPEGGCFNCHTFLNYDSDRFAFQVRHQNRGYLVLSDRGEVTLHELAYRKPGASFLAWHPSGKAIALTVGMRYTLLNLFAGVVPEETLEFVDTGGDICVYRIAENRLTTTPAISREDRMETHPAWSPDGKHLYFVSAANAALNDYQDIRYDLRRIAYDVDSDTWGKCETLISTADTGKSCTFPRVSPDGRFLLFCMTDRSSLSLLRDHTDLYMMDLRDRSFRRLEINREHTDSYHSWSSSGRWFAFVSKRRDGVHGLVYLSHVDEDGNVSRPFLLPQRDPAFYRSFVKTFNVPEFLCNPIDVSRIELGRQVTKVESITPTK